MKNYKKPEISEEVLELEDIIATSMGGDQAGDLPVDLWPDENEG